MEFVVKADNFKGGLRVVTADTGARLLENVKKAYVLVNVPDTMDVQVWAGYEGVRRLRLDQEKTLDPAVLSPMAHVRIVPKLREPNQCPVPVETGRAVSEDCS
jgi:hypothetical protein